MKKRKSILTSIANRASTTVLKSPKTRAMTVSQNPAMELCYSEEVKRKIAQAKSVYEIGRILKQARLDQE